MYNQYLKVINTYAGTNQVVSKVDIPAKVPIIEMTGNLIEGIDRVDPNTSQQVSQIFHIGPSGNVDDYINHSCNPNCYLHIVGVRAILYSLYVIKAGTELTYDYSLSSTDTYDVWKMDCKCGSFNCRKVISGYHYLSDDLKNTYKKLGIVPIFIGNVSFSRKVFVGY